MGIGDWAQSPIPIFKRFIKIFFEIIEFNDMINSKYKVLNIIEGQINGNK